MSKHATTLRWLNRLWLLVAAVIIVGGLIVAAGRALMPRVSGFEQPLQQWLTARLGSDLSVAAMRGTWEGGPRLELTDVALAERPGSATRMLARRALVGVDFWASLR